MAAGVNTPGDRLDASVDDVVDALVAVNAVNAVNADRAPGWHAFAFM